MKQAWRRFLYWLQNAVFGFGECSHCHRPLTGQEYLAFGDECCACEPWYSPVFAADPFDEE